jgi:hypothetical protein
LPTPAVEIAQVVIAQIHAHAEQLPQPKISHQFAQNTDGTKPAANVSLNTNQVVMPMP